MSAEHAETPTSVTIVSLGYRARCTEPASRNLGRLILRYAGAVGLKVYDDRTVRASTGD
jgi:hypothetical protein